MYQEKLSSLQAQQDRRREEFLGKESEERLRQYQQAATDSIVMRNAPNEHHGFSGSYQSMYTGSVDSYTERSSFPWRGQGDERVAYPPGRAYDQTVSRH